jgi:DNA-binding LytR/AlgR family response regulator
VIRVLLVDDHGLFRSGVRSELEGKVEVVGEAATAAEALVLLDSLHYDIVFVDVRMPGIGGLALAERIRSIEQPAAVVFTTAYPDHAVEAFDLAATDYLLKPIDGDRLRRAIDRALADDRHGDEAPDDGAEPGERARAAGEALGRVPVQKGERTVLVDETSIVYASAARGFSYLKLADEKVLVGFTLADLEQRLSGRFFRCHRSHLVNFDRVRELLPDFNGALVLVMDDKQRSRVPVSRRQARELRRILGM